jgi:hypothetical protein
MNTTILKLRPAARPDLALGGTADDLVTLFGLDRLPARRPRLVAHWHRQPDGRLACVWEPDLALSPARAD